MMGALAALYLADADRLVRTASVAATSSPSRHCPARTSLSPRLTSWRDRPHPGRLAVAAEMRHLLRDSELQQAHHGSTHKVQDPYSLRCVPQVHGAVRDALDQLRRVLDIEAQLGHGQPARVPRRRCRGPGRDRDGRRPGDRRRHFHGEPLALALDYAKLAIAELGSISERRMALLVDPRLNGGLPFLAAASGVESGMMIYQYTAAALVGAQGPRSSGLRGFDPNVRQPGRTTSRWARSPRAARRRPRKVRADRGDRAGDRRPGARPAIRIDGAGRGDAAAGCRGGPRPMRGSAPASAPRSRPRTRAGPGGRDGARPRRCAGGSDGTRRLRRNRARLTRD